MSRFTLYSGQLVEPSTHVSALQIDSMVSMRIIRANTPAMPMTSVMHKLAGFFMSGRHA